MVFCRKYQREMEALERPPYPGPGGRKIQETVSKKAWEEWQHHQTMLINELHLSMTDPEARRFLQQEMEKFFANEEYARPKGYVPPE